LRHPTEYKGTASFPSSKPAFLSLQTLYAFARRLLFPLRTNGLPTSLPRKFSLFCVVQTVFPATLFPSAPPYAAFAGGPSPSTAFFSPRYSRDFFIRTVLELPLDALVVRSLPPISSGDERSAFPPLCASGITYFFQENAFLLGCFSPPIDLVFFFQELRKCHAGCSSFHFHRNDADTSPPYSFARTPTICIFPPPRSEATGGDVFLFRPLLSLFFSSSPLCLFFSSHFAGLATPRL